MNSINYKEIEATKTATDFSSDYYTLTQQCQFLSDGNTKEEALANYLYELRCESDDDLVYEETRCNLIEKLEKSELFEDAYNEWPKFEHQQ